MITTSEVKNIYSSLQKQLFYLVPEKWDKIYLYASVVEQMLNLETGELFFYYYPKGILKRKPINVYEIPNKFSLDEEGYVKLVEKLYNTIKSLRDVYKRANVRLWSSITIKLVDLKFEIEFNYEDLTLSEYSSQDRHIIWKYINLDLPLESFSRKERKLISDYIDNHVIDINMQETYSESIYKRPIKNVIDYNKEKIQNEMQKEYSEDIEPKKQELSTYTYVKKQKKGIKKQYKKKDNNEEEKKLTYVEQIEAQRNAVKSQILNHL